MRAFNAAIAIMLLILSCVTTQQTEEVSKVNIIPKPTKVKLHEGDFVVTAETAILINSQNERAQQVGEYLTNRLRTSTGLALSVANTNDPKSQVNSIVLSTKKKNRKLGPEGYALEVTPQHVLVEANEPAGLFYGVQTLLQLLPPEVNSYNRVSQLQKLAMPCVKIEDQPRYKWRGMHLDVCRHFYPKEFLKKYIDLIAMHKMNMFHLHLTEDQGWRIEIKKYPKLTEVGAWRVDREGIHWNEREDQRPGEKATYGGFYTQDDIREIVNYAESRFVTVVPEIEMPGHCTAALAAYPQYSCTGGPFTVKPGGIWPIMDVYCPGKEGTFQFLEDVLSEVIALFPTEYVHIGADEVNKTRWENCPDCQARIKAEGLKNEKELQSYFVKRIEKFLISKNKKLIGWDEILEGGLAPEATVMSWRGMEGGIESAHQGHDVVMSPTSHCYFDYYQGVPSQEPLAIGGYLPLSKVYEFEPTPSELNRDEAKHILGAQGNVWTEYIPKPEDVEYMALPRMSALAEVVWSTKKHRNFENFLRRMAYQYLRLDAMDVHYRQPDFFHFDGTQIFVKEAILKIQKPRPYSKIRYTTDGTEPTENSPEYQAPIRVSETTEFTFQEFLPNGKKGKIQKAVFAKQQLLAPVQTRAVDIGIDYRYFELDKEIKSTAELEGQKITRTGRVDDFRFPPGGVTEYFGLELEGLIEVPSKGVYTFTTVSNDGSRLYVHGTLVVDNDGSHGSLERSGQIALAEGRHPIKVVYFQGGGSRDLRVFIEGPRLTKREIKSTMLSHAVD